MTTKEKAEAYDEAKARMSRAFNSNRCTLDFMNEIFPELAESGDEKIRKGLIGYFRAGKCENISSYHGISTNDILAWLEKQAEQKTDDKVEPKFEIGDLITNGILVGKIDEIHEHGYHAYFGDHYADVPDVENWHKWTIQDAKDGDVLCTYECGRPKSVFILKGTPKKHYALGYHCYCNIMYPHFESDSEKGCLSPNDEDVKPATKEQRDTLIKAITDAGYTFDFENKELKKIEQKPAWSEEDEQYFNFLEKLLNNLQVKSTENEIKKGTNSHSEYYFKVIQWLKSIKDKVQPKQEWNEQEQVRINRIVSCLENLNVADNDILLKDVDWLKALSPQNRWKPSREQIKALEMAVEGNIPQPGIIQSILEQLKKLITKE